MEPRSILASYDPSEDRYTIWTPSQNPHSLRFWLANDSLFVPEHKLRVVAPDFGGSFGQRSYHYPEERSEEHTSELQSLMRISYAVFCLKTKKRQIKNNTQLNNNLLY